MGRKDAVVEIMQSTQEWTMPKFMCVCVCVFLVPAVAMSV